MKIHVEINSEQDKKKFEALKKALNQDSECFCLDCLEKANKFNELPTDRVPRDFESRAMRQAFKKTETRVEQIRKMMMEKIEGVLNADNNKTVK